MSVRSAIGVESKPEDISMAHPMPYFNPEAPPKIVLKFTWRDARSEFYVNRRKMLYIKTQELRDLELEEENNIYIFESLMRYKKKLFGEVNKVKKRLKWKHIWTQDERIFS